MVETASCSLGTCDPEGVVCPESVNTIGSYRSYKGRGGRWGGGECDTITLGLAASKSHCLKTVLEGKWQEGEGYRWSRGTVFANAW